MTWVRGSGTGFWICTLPEFACSDPASVVDDKGGLVGVAEFESAIVCLL